VSDNECLFAITRDPKITIHHIPPSVIDMR